MFELHRCMGAWAYCDGDCSKCNTTAMTAAAQLYLIQPTVDVPERNVEKWIPVTERLPEDERYVLVTTVNGDVTEAKYWQKERFWVLKGLAIMNVTAWMPLPEPYREETEDAEIH